MGKIRINTIGDENLEKKQKAEAKKRQEAKNAEKTNEKEETLKQQPIEEKKEKKKNNNKSKIKEKIRSPRYIFIKKNIDRNKQYNLSEAIELLYKMKPANFDETVELHINMTEKGISGNITLPHGTGKKTKVVIISPSKDSESADKTLKKIESGKIDFDVLIATPDAMPRLAKVARILGPKGLMPNPKSGTVTSKPEELAKKYEGGQINYKTELKSPIIHVAIGKISFGKEKLSENINFFLTSIDKTKMKNAYVKSTMSPSLKLAI